MTDLEMQLEGELEEVKDQLAWAETTMGFAAVLRRLDALTDDLENRVIQIETHLAPPPILPHAQA